MSTLDQARNVPRAAVEYANILLTTNDAPIGQSPREVIWTHRKTTLYRYRSSQRRHAVPVLLVFALINRPDIFDLRPGHSFVEFLLEEGFDVFLVDWGRPGDEDADMGIDNYILDELHWAVRETLRASGQEEVTLLGWCIGGTFCAMYGALENDGPVRNMVLLTTAVDTTQSNYTPWVGSDEFDVNQVTDVFGAIPGRGVDTMNKLQKPVTNFWTTYRKLWQQTLDGSVRREAYQSMAKWVADNPPWAGRAYREWITWMYKENRLVKSKLTLRGRLVDLHNINQNLLVITAGADHITKRPETTPLLDMVSSADVTHFDRAGGHIGLMAGSKARKEIWPDIAEWLAERSGR